VDPTNKKKNNILLQQDHKVRGRGGERGKEVGVWKSPFKEGDRRLPSCVGEEKKQLEKGETEALYSKNRTKEDAKVGGSSNVQKGAIQKKKKKKKKKKPKKKRDVGPIER